MTGAEIVECVGAVCIAAVACVTIYCAFRFGS